jgi:hypothetical protein
VDVIIVDVAQNISICIHMYIVSSLAICKYELYVSMSNIELCKLLGKFFMILEIHMHSLCLDIVL